MNPARSIGVAWFAGGAALGQVWLFIVAPIIGAVIAGASYAAITGAKPAPSTWASPTTRTWARPRRPSKPWFAMGHGSAPQRCRTIPIAVWTAAVSGAAVCEVPVTGAAHRLPAQRAAVLIRDGDQREVEQQDAVGRFA